MSVIREMEKKDLAAVALLEQESFTVPWSEKLLAESLDNPLDRAWVLEDAGELAGYYCFRVVAGEGELMRIAVFPSKRGRGYAREMMEHLAEAARSRGAEEITLEVRASNTPAVSLYKSYGFKTEAVRKRYYTHPNEDAFIMWRRCN